MHVRGRRRRRVPPRRRVGRRQPGLLAAGRRGAAAADHRRLVRRGADRAGSAPCGGRDAVRRRMPSPGGSGIDAPDHTPRTSSPSTSTGRAGCWSAPTDCGTTARRRSDLAELVAEARLAARAPNPWPLADALVDWANAQGGQDNITVALARIAIRPEPRTHSPPPRSVRSPRHTERKSRTMATFSAEVYQNEFLPDGGTDVHAIVTVTCTGAGEAGQSGVGRCRRDRHRRHLGLDGRGQHRGRPATRRRRRSTRCSTASGSRSSPAATRRGWPFPQAASSAWSGWTQRTRAEAKARDRRRSRRRRHGHGHLADPGDAASSPSVPGAGAEARDPADRRDEPARDPGRAECRDRGGAGQFQCDCRGVGADWQVAEVRRIATALLGSVDLIATAR